MMTAPPSDIEQVNAILAQHSVRIEEDGKFRATKPMSEEQLFEATSLVLIRVGPVIERLKANADDMLAVVLAGGTTRKRA